MRFSFLKSKKHLYVFLILALIFVALSAIYLFVKPAPQTFYLAEDIINKNQEFSRLLVDLLQKRIDRVITLGNLYLEENKISDLARDGEWEQAILNLRPILEEEPSINRIFLVDQDGIPKGDFPPLPYKVESFAFRDWYKGTIAKKSPYVSEVYKRAAEPRINVIAVAFPLKSNDSIIGVLGLQLAADTWLSWIKEVKITPESVIFVIDKNGHVVAHPDIDPQAEIVDYSSEPDVKNLLQGRASTEFIIDPELGSFISSYKWIPEHQIGIIARVPIKVNQ
ncbi:MAG: cache domain-containing protein [Parcubacteria group bacterium]|nr:cache domain-containing protein [Parcubacteria group bacterium]